MKALTLCAWRQSEDGNQRRLPNHWLRFTASPVSLHCRK